MRFRRVRRFNGERFNFAHTDRGWTVQFGVDYVLMYDMVVGSEWLTGLIGVQSHLEESLLSSSANCETRTGSTDRRYSHFGGRHITGVSGLDGSDLYTVRTGGTTERTIARTINHLAMRLDDDDVAAEDINFDAPLPPGTSFYDALSITPTLSGDYLIVGIGAVRCGTASKDIESQLLVNGSAVGFCSTRLRDTNERRPWGGFTKVTGLSGAQAFQTQVKSVDGVTGVSFDQSLIQCVRLDTLRDYQYDEELGLGQDNTGVYVPRASVTVNGPGEYWVLASAQLARNVAAAAFVKGRVRVGADVVHEVSVDPPTLYEETLFYSGRHIINSSTTCILEWATGVAPRNANIRNATIVAMNLTPIHRLINKGTKQLRGTIQLR